jgi:hypothetical protein
MSEERCEIKIKPDKKFGWKLEVKGCSETLKKIEENLKPYSLRFFTERTEIVED